MRYILMARDEEKKTQIYYDKKKGIFREVSYDIGNYNNVSISIVILIGMILVNIVNSIDNLVTKAMNFLGIVGCFIVILLLGIGFGIMSLSSLLKELHSRGSQKEIYIGMENKFTRNRLNELYKRRIEIFFKTVGVFFVSVVIFIVAFPFPKLAFGFIIINSGLFGMILHFFIRDTPLSKRKAIGIYEQYLNKQ